MTFFDSNAASIGIIGGADGPTAIFLTGDIQSLVLGVIAAAMLVIAAIVIAARKRK